MSFTKKDRELLSSAFTTECARVKRAMNTASNQSIKEIYQADLHSLSELEGRILSVMVEKTK